jgi:long-chain acyl-CoA synthetase
VADPAETFPRLIQRQARERPRAPAFREKYLGIWQVWSWEQVAQETRAFACGLAALGFPRGGHLALVGDNRPRLYWAMAAAQCVGGVSVPLYQDSVAQEIAYVLQDAEATLVVAEDQEQVDKLLEALPQCPRLKYIVFDDARGLRRYQQPQLMSFDRVQDLGREYDRQHSRFFADAIAEGDADDVATILYTSGTTGNPKGVALTHRAMIATGRAYADLEHLGPHEEVLAYLPMAWVGQNLFSYAQSLVAGFCVSCPESAETVMSDMREIGPTYYFAPPRVLEALLTQVTIRMEDASRLKRALYRYFMRVARRVGPRILSGAEGMRIADRILYRLGDWLIYGPLRNVLGMSRVRVAYTAGEAIGPDLFTFYRSIGINLKQIYGQTETTVCVCVQPDGQVKPDTVGPPLPGVELKLAESGEVLVRTPGLFRDYHRNPRATAEARDAEGYFHTGDAGYFDADGHLKIVDRAKDVGRLADGTLFAPKYIENKLKFSPYIREAVCFGHGRDKVCALINIDMEAIGNWAEKRGLSYSGYADIAAQPAVYDLIRDCIEQCNRELSAEATLAHSQIQRFLILHKELDADDGELTRTRKVRRRHVGEKYAALVEALYAGKTHCYIETQVRFEDGRTGVVSADVRIAEARVFADAARQAA